MVGARSSNAMPASNRASGTARRMTRNLLIGLTAGLASALLFASILSGSPLALVLCLAAPLPIMIVGLGWTHLAGLVAAVSASMLLGFGLSDGGFDFRLFLVFL